MHQPSSNTTAASQRLNNLRLNTHNINQRRMDQPTGSFLGRCLQTVCRSYPACLGYLRLFFCNIKMRNWVEQRAEAHGCLFCLVPTAPLSPKCCFEGTAQDGSHCYIQILGMCPSWGGGERKAERSDMGGICVTLGKSLNLCGLIHLMRGLVFCDSLISSAQKLQVTVRSAQVTGGHYLGRKLTAPLNAASEWIHVFEQEKSLLLISVLKSVVLRLLRQAPSVSPRECGHGKGHTLR
nr:uncharacterized protein LOC105472672 [Macaca nemestrina]